MKKEKPTTKLCKHCKTEIPYDAKVCPNCRKKQKGGKLKWILIIAVVAVIALLIYGSGNSYKLSEDASNMSEKDYKAACGEIEYKELAGSAEKYKGNKVKFEGQIQQVAYDSENGESEYLIHVTKDDLGLWSDSIYVYYANNPTANLSRMISLLFTARLLEKNLHKCSWSEYNNSSNNSGIYGIREIDITE